MVFDGLRPGRRGDKGFAFPAHRFYLLLLRAPARSNRGRRGDEVYGWLA